MRVALLVLLGLATAVSGGGRTHAAAPLVYVALGDSTAVGLGAEQGGGYPDRLTRRLATAGTPVRLVNLGVPGATAEDLRKLQVPRALADAPTLITIGIGINDVIRGRALADFARDLEIAADALGRTRAAVVISELPDLSGSPSAAGAPTARALGRRVAAYNATIRRVAERHGFTVGEVELVSRRAFAGHPELFARDGLHPSARGYTLWADALWPAVERALAPHVQGRRPAPSAAAR